MSRRFLLVLSSICLLSPICRADVTDARPIFVEGYAGKVSYKPGEELSLHVSTSASKFAVEITRLGARPEVVFSKPDVPGTESPVPENASSHGCQWPAALKLPVAEAWRSGYYHVTLKVEDTGGKFFQRGKRTAESSCFFIVRAAQPGKNSRILLQLSTNTYNAYNNWGGFSLYSYNGRECAGTSGFVPATTRQPVFKLGISVCRVG